MNIFGFILNWILNWMVFKRYSMFEWIIEIYRPPLRERGSREIIVKSSFKCYQSISWLLSIIQVLSINHSSFIMNQSLDEGDSWSYCISIIYQLSIIGINYELWINLSMKATVEVNPSLCQFVVVLIQVIVIFVVVF